MVRAPDKIPGRLIGCGLCVLLALAGAVIVLIFYPFGPTSRRVSREAAVMHTCRSIALAEFQYANDNGGNYPEGESSTEVFQKLLDGNYINDAAMFYLPMPGKIPPTGRKLKPENVSYDVTSGVNSGHFSQDLPVVFLTGFRLEYRSGGSAISLQRPLPLLWNNFVRSLPIAYLSRSSTIESRDILPAKSSPQVNAQGYAVLPNVVPADFSPRGMAYRQLTPDGVLK